VSPPYANALVTGASSGIGRALSLELARMGVPVLLAARREPLLREVADEIRAHGGEARVVVLDVTDTERTVARLRAIDAELGGLDLVIANAGVGAPRRDLPSYAWENLEGALHTNVCGAAATLTAALPEMVVRRRGHLVGIGSLASYGALPDAAAYCAPKAGLAMLLDCLRLDLAGTGVAVTRVDLGFVATPMVALSTHPMPQLASAEHAARVVAAALPKRPRRVVFPRALAAATRALASVPSPIKEALVAASKSAR
jgi:short-subunit dehydrogenase